MSETVSIEGNTLIMGMIGSPVAQVRTPQVINPIFASAKANIVCMPFYIDDIEAAMSGLKAMRNLVGFGVTLPHKQRIAELCDSLDLAAEQAGAVNVVRRERDGSFRGYQFDGRGFVGGLCAQGHDPKGRSVLVLGAGGASAAIVTALVAAGASDVGISNRTQSKAEALAQSVSASVGGHVYACQASPKPGQIVINATSLGMDAADPLPLDPAHLDASMLVAEVVAKPAVTELLHQARQRGAAVHSGQHMIASQVPMIAEHFLELYGPTDRR